jgi:hypothetical protein
MASDKLKPMIMKTMAKDNKANKKLVTKHIKRIESEELETEHPISEKDEVKEAERKLQKNSK